MLDFEFSSHAKDMVIERRIPEEWVWRTVNTPRKKKWMWMGTCTMPNLSRKEGAECSMSS
jgi:hypothetical protein